MLRIKFGEREWRFDDEAPQTMLDIEALVEMGVDPDNFGGLLSSAADQMRKGATSGRDTLLLARSCAQIAFIAELRQNHETRWRAFLSTLPLDDLRAFDLAPVETEQPPTAAGGVGAALASVQTTPTKKVPTKRATPRKSPRAAARS